MTAPLIDVTMPYGVHWSVVEGKLNLQTTPQSADKTGGNMVSPLRWYLPPGTNMLQILTNLPQEVRLSWNSDPLTAGTPWDMVTSVPAGTEGVWRSSKPIEVSSMTISGILLSTVGAPTAQQVTAKRSAALKVIPIPRP